MWKIVVYIGRWGGGGILGYIMPRLLIAFGVPLDDWINGLPVGVNREVIYCLIMVVSGILLISLTYIIPYLLRKKGGNRIDTSFPQPNAASSFQDRLSFIEAAKDGNVSAIESLLDKGVDVNTIDRDGNTALIWATRHGQRACVQKLIEKGSNVNAKANDGNTAFTFASIKSYGEIIDILKKSGADSIKYQDPKILDAAFNGDVDTLKVLLEKGVSPNTITHASGETTLMYAAGRNHFECANLLLKFGADVNIKAKNGHTVFNAIDFIKGKAKMLDLIESYKNIVLNSNVSFIVFNPNASIPEILDSHNISGVFTDSGYLAFTFTFDEPLENENYMIRTAGTANFEYELFNRTRNSFSIQFGEPCPDLVRLEFVL